MTVYADVLVVVNSIVNLLLLLASAKLLGVVTCRWRLCAGALVGALGSLVIFLPYVGMWFQALYKILLALAMAAAAFGVRPWQRLAKALFVTFAVSFLFAGLMLALSHLLAPAGMIFYNGVVYFDISVLALILSTTAAYLLLLLFERLFAGRVDEHRLYEITVTAGGRAVSCKGLADTGSDLREPFSGAPVIVCDRTLAERVRPPEHAGFRVIPCRTVTGEGALEGFRPDEIQITGGGRTIRTSDVYIAASREPISGEYQALINPQIIDRAH